jgi:hypothetical protein
MFEDLPTLSPAVSEQLARQFEQLAETVMPAKIRAEIAAAIEAAHVAIPPELIAEIAAAAELGSAELGALADRVVMIGNRDSRERPLLRPAGMARRGGSGRHHPAAPATFPELG